MRILHLEDNPDDAELVRGVVAREWPQSELVLARTRAEYEAALTRGPYDLILSDFSLPQFDGLEALREARRLAGDVPFIFLSGNIGEDRAIEAVHAGADDYVLKDRSKRLVTAIARAIREAGERLRLRAMEAERTRLAATLESSPDLVVLSSPEGRILYLNRRAREVLDVPAGPLAAGLHLDSLHPPGVRPQLWDQAVPAAMRDGTWSGESLMVTRNGREVPVAQTIVAHRGANGAIEYLSAVLRDLTAWKRAEAIVNGQNQVLEMIAGGEPVAETLTTLSRVIEAQAEEMFCSILLAEDDGQHLRHCAGPRLPAEYVAAIDRVAVAPDQGACGAAAFQRAFVITADIATDPHWERVRTVALAHGLRACWSTPIFDADHRLLGTFAVYLRTPGEPTERQRQLTDVAVHMAAICLSRAVAERRLREQADILNLASDTIIVVDGAQRVTFWNRGAERTFGPTAGQVAGRTLAEVFGADAEKEFEPGRSATLAGQPWHGELRLSDRAGQPHIMETRLTPIRDEAGQLEGGLLIATDVSARKRIEEQFFRAQRLESIGMLAAGIAHDLNNVLAPILLAAPMLRDHATDPSDLRMISTLEKSAERGAGLVRQILGFAHGADGAHRLLQPKHLLRDAAGFMEETFPKTIEVDQSFPSDLWPVKGNPTQLHQVLLNLCVNARDAMPGGGTLTLRGENAVLDETAAAAIEGGLPGPFVVFHVQDTGTGIAPDVLARMWEPFYTTKASGKGTGLGLSTVRGIVESHGGFVSVHTIPGRGTTFRVHFPAAEFASGEPAGGTPVSVIARGMGELVLVVDDEPGIRNMAAAILARHGYRVLTAADGAEAIALFAPRSKEIRVVITDLSMPNLDGAALAGVVQRINPAVKIIAVSGHGVDADGELHAPPVSDAFIVKPFRPEVLLTTVHELLRAPPNPPP